MTNNPKMARLLLISVAFATLVICLSLPDIFKAKPRGNPFSEQFVTRKIEYDAKGSAPRGGFLPLPPEYVHRFPDSAYRSNPGWQGIVLSTIRRSLFMPVENFIPTAKVGFSVLFFVSFFMFFLFVSRALSSRLSIIAAASYAIVSSVLYAFSSNLYWVTFLFFLGPLLIFFVRSKHDVLSPERLRAVFLVSASSVFIKSLCGYEWVSFFILNNAWAVAFLLLSSTRQNQLATTVSALVKVVLCGAAGFFLAVLVHLVQGYVAYADLQQALDPILSRMLAHAGAVSKANELFTTFQAPEHAYPSATLSNALSPYLKQKMFVPVTTALPFFAAFVIAMSLVAMKSRLFNFIDGKKALPLRPLLLLTLLSYIPPLSWLVLQPSHALVHPHINIVMFAAISFPLTLIALLEGTKAVLADGIARGHRPR